MDSVDKKARQIVSAYFHEQVKSVHPITGKGIVNQVAIVETGSFKAVIRMNGLSSLEEYLKEKWCLEQASATGIPGPEVLSVGTTEDTAYMILSFVEGTNGVDSDEPKASVWRQLGEYARRIHAIPVEGYGEQLSEPLRGVFSTPPHEGFDGSWHSFVRYNADSLTAGDRLIELGVISLAESRQAKTLFEELQRPSVRFGLNHGDLSLKNTVVHPNGRVYLLDWGSAEVNLVPYRDLIGLLQSTGDKQTDESLLQAFLDGYGMTGYEYAGLQHELKSFQLLLAFDKLRWAIDKRADLIHTYASYARRVADRVFK